MNTSQTNAHGFSAGVYAAGRMIAQFKTQPPEWKIHWLLRIAIAAEFIGHGAFGIIGKEAWLSYYAVFGIPASWAWVMMPLTGLVDISLGLFILLRPTRAPLAYMAAWGLFTALLRPLSGESWWEFVERSYNFGIPFALLMLHGIGHSRREWLERIREIPRLTREQAHMFAWGLRAIISAYLIGHGAYGVFTHKPVLIDHYQSIGLDSLANLAQIVGWFEIALGVLVLAPAYTVGLLVFVCVWKIATEMLYVTSGARGAAFEVIERASSYAAPLALICILAILTHKAEKRLGDSRMPLATAGNDR